MIDKTDNKKKIQKQKIKIGSKTKFTVLAIVLIAIFSISLCPVTLQNDTFYTIKIGEYITQNGIDMKDHFSWHGDLDYTFPHWLYDVMTYHIYNLFGMSGIFVATCLLAMTLGIVLYLVNSKLAKNQLISFIITIGAMFVIRDYIAARAQLVTFILFVLTILFIEQFLETKKKRFAIRISCYTYNNCKCAFSSISILFYIISTLYRRIYCCDNWRFNNI